MLETLILILRLFDPAGVEFAPVIAAQSAKYDVDPLIVVAVMWKESRFNKEACYRGSHGLMQIQLRGRSCEKTVVQARSLKLYDPEENIRRGVEAMRSWRNWCRSQKHDHHWLYHYNQGYGSCPEDKPKCRAQERRVFTGGRARGYVESILGIFNRLKRIQRKVQVEKLNG